MNIVNHQLLNQVLSSLSQAQIRFSDNLNDDLLSDGLIHRFKVAYDLSHKILKSHLNESRKNDKQISQMTFRELITEAHQRGILLSGWPEWQLYREQRVQTIEAFDQVATKKVLSIIPDFIKEVQFLYRKITHKEIEIR
jgi:nucleotidyltransferase substrate binding protein (TIGR01987 family)